VRTPCLAVTACAIGLTGETTMAQDRDALVVRTEAGLVRGVHNGAVDAFLGIPYGASPVGDKRWRPPQPAESWNDIREAKAFGAYCAAEKHERPAIRSGRLPLRQCVAAVGPLGRRQAAGLCVHPLSGCRRPDVLGSWERKPRIGVPCVRRRGL
jgi:Carboxylesterase family